MAQHNQPTSTNHENQEGDARPNSKAIHCKAKCNERSSVKLNGIFCLKLFFESDFDFVAGDDDDNDDMM